jgi:hypothetical protein
MDNNNDLNNLNYNDESNNQITPTEPIQTVEPIQSAVTDTNNLEYQEVLKPGEELDDFHHEAAAEVIDTKFLSNNVLSIVTLIIAFFIPVIPLILAIISLLQIKKTHQGGKPLAIIAIVVNILVIIIEIFISLYVFRVGPFVDKMKNVTDNQMTICKNSAYGCDNDEDGDGFKTCSYCKDGTECNDIITIECPTDKLIEKENKNKETRKKFGLNN